MTEQITQKPEPTLEEVRIQFETWRKIKRGRQPIPDQLWQAALFPSGRRAQPVFFTQADSDGLASAEACGCRVASG